MKRNSEEKKRKRLIIAFSVFIVLSMVISIFAIVIDNNQNDSLTYNDHDFKITNMGYNTKVDGTRIDFQYFPTEVERINLSDEILSKLNNPQVKTIVILFDPNESVENLQYIDFAIFELSKEIKTQIVSAKTQESSDYTTLPVLNCENATIDYPFILINSSSQTSFELDSNNKNCIIMNAKYKEVLAAKDRLAYRLLGIMPN